FFFFSSRRRHTRSLRDWSSDVCSSDLWRLPVTLPFSLEKTARALQRLPANETQVWRDGALFRSLRMAGDPLWLRVEQPSPEAIRSEERRVGKECRSGWEAEH